MDELFVKIVNGDIPSYKLYEDELTYSFLDINPLSEGHCLVIPKKKYTKIDEVPPATAKALGETVAKVANALKIATGCHDYNVLQNNGKSAHQEVPHVHFHIIPKQSNGEGLGVTWKSSKLENAEKVQKKITDALISLQDKNRLCRDVVPRNYNVSLKPDFKTFKFDG